MFRGVSEKTSWRAVVIGWAVAIATGVVLNLLFEAAHILLFGGDVYTASGEVIRGGQVLFENGKIVKAGQSPLGKESFGRAELKQKDVKEDRLPPELRELPCDGDPPELLVEDRPLVAHRLGKDVVLPIGQRLAGGDEGDVVAAGGAGQLAAPHLGLLPADRQHGGRRPAAAGRGGVLGAHADRLVGDHLVAPAHRQPVLGQRDVDAVGVAHQGDVRGPDVAGRPVGSDRQVHLQPVALVPVDQEHEGRAVLPTTHHLRSQAVSGSGV